MDNEINFSIIIPTAGRSFQLENCLKSINKYISSFKLFEVLVIDNNQFEEFSENIKSIVGKYAFCKYIRCKNPGLTAARHMGLKKSLGDILCYVDDDVEFSNTWFKSIEETFNDEEISLAGGPTLPNFRNNIPLWFWDFIKKTPYGGWSCEWLSLLDIGQDIMDINPNYIWGLNFSIRKKILIECGGFNIDIVPKKYLRLQGDGETGLTEKFLQKGYKAVYKQKSLLYHYCGKDRLTIEYFKKRAYFEGTCACYRDLRICKGFKNKRLLLKIKFQMIFFRLVFRKILFKKINQIIYLFKINKNVVHIKQECFKSFNNGYLFLLKETKNNRKLLNWIWKDNYIDVDIRNEISNYQ